MGWVVMKGMEKCLLSKMSYLFNAFKQPGVVTIEHQTKEAAINLLERKLDLVLFLIENIYSFCQV